MISSVSFLIIVSSDKCENQNWLILPPFPEKVFEEKISNKMGNKPGIGNIKFPTL